LYEEYVNNFKKYTFESQYMHVFRKWTWYIFS